MNQRDLFPKCYLLDLALELQIMILKYVLQPPSIFNSDTTFTDFPFTDSIIPFTVPFSPLITPKEGLLQTNRYLRHIGLTVLFECNIYAPVCLCVRWFFQLRFIDIYKQVKSRPCLIKRQILLSQAGKWRSRPMLGISYWTRLVLPVNVFWPHINSDLRSISTLLKKMISLQSLHLILVLLPDQTQKPDWNILLRVFNDLPLRNMSLTIYRFLRWHEQLLIPIPSLAIPDGPLYRPTINSEYFFFEALNLAKDAGIHDFDKLLHHTASISLQSYLAS